MARNLNCPIESKNFLRSHAVRYTLNVVISRKHGSRPVVAGDTADRIPPFPMSLSDLRRHSLTARLFKYDFSLSFAEVGKISPDS